MTYQLHQVQNTLENLLVQWYWKTCSSIRGEPTELESLKMRGGMGDLEDI